MMSEVTEHEALETYKISILFDISFAAVSGQMYCLCHSSLIVF